MNMKLNIVFAVATVGILLANVGPASAEPGKQGDPKVCGTSCHERSGAAPTCNTETQCGPVVCTEVKVCFNSSGRKVFSQQIPGTTKPAK
jgi:hypothetical protein